MNDLPVEFKWAIRAGVALFCVGLVLAMAPYTTVAAGERGVVTRVGAVNRVLEPGLHWLTPFVESVHKFDVQTQRGEATASAASSDLQNVSTNITLNYNPDPQAIQSIYTELGEEYETKVIPQAVQESVKAATAKYTAEELITKRPEVKEQIQNNIVSALQQYHIIITSVSVTDFDFSESFNRAIEEKVTAEQNALASKNKLEQVKYEAQQQIETAKATAEAQRIQSAALAAQGGEDYVQLKAIEKWNGILPTQMIPGSTVPFINLNK